MRIIVRNGNNTDVNLAIPTNLILNRASLLILQYICKKHEIAIPRKRLVELMKCIRKYKRYNPSWKLVEVEGADGEVVEISL